MYLLITSSSICPMVSAKYPSAQKLSPQRNSSNSGYSFRIIRLVPPFRVWTTPAMLSLGFIWMMICTWSSWMLSSLIHHRFILHASYNSRFSRIDILPRSTLLRYFGIHTKWHCSLCLVWDPVQYLVGMSRSCRKFLRDATKMCRRSGRPFIPELKSSGFSGRFYKNRREPEAESSKPAVYLETNNSINDFSS